MARLVLGPLQRYADQARVTVWVETDRPCEVAVDAHRARTVELLGHHFAFVTVHDVGEARPYTVTVDGEVVWPCDERFPESLLRPVPTDRVRVALGSCRSILPEERDDADRIDALREYACRAASGSTDALPDALLLLGDQVYADKHAPAARAFIRRRRAARGPTGTQASDFTEYAALYHEAWSEPAVRWLLSTVPTFMVFDDHEVLDNWNTSARWVAEHQVLSWWRQRIVGALAAYWVYQHLGNLSPEERADDACFAALQHGDVGPALRSFATRASHGTEGTVGVRWSYARDLGPTRLAMIDSRDGRVLTGGQRHMLDEDEWAWLEAEAANHAPYLLLGTSLPLLLPPGLHELERVITAACAGRWGPAGAWIGEHLRRGFQFNHWPAFPPSFRRAVQLLQTAASPPRRGVLVLSGDVHYSYLARVRGWPDGTRPAVPVHQITSSPLCYDLHRTIAGSFRAIITRPGELLGRWAARAAGAPPTALDWQLESGPWLHSAVATLSLGSDGGSVRFERTVTQGREGERLETVAELGLG